MCEYVSDYTKLGQVSSCKNLDKNDTGIIQISWKTNITCFSFFFSLPFQLSHFENNLQSKISICVKN